MSNCCAPVSKLLATDQVDAFDCGQTALNQFLQRYAFANQRAHSAQTYVCCQGDLVVGFYSFAVGSVEPHAAPSSVLKGPSRHPVPVVILARLAVDKEHQHKGLGQALLKDALLRTAQAADIAGIRQGCQFGVLSDGVVRFSWAVAVRGLGLASARGPLLERACDFVV